MRYAKGMVTITEHIADMGSNRLQAYERPILRRNQMEEL
jgi:hypothetical protein